MRLIVVIKGPCVTLQMLGSLFNRLRAQNKLAVYKAKKPRDVSYADLLQSGFLFLRSSQPEALALAKKLNLINKSYAYYIDDDFWNIPPQASSYAHFANPETRQIIDYFMTHASLVLTQSAYLAELLEKRFNRPVTLMPSFFDFDSLPYKQLPAPPLDKPIKIGFSGTVREAEFEQLLIPSFNMLKSRYDDRIQFDYLGATPNIVARFNDLFNQNGLFNLLVGSNTDYAGFLKIKHEAQWAIGVSPLFDNTFARCKSDLKFRDYAALGIPAVFSNVHPYKSSIISQQTGILADNTIDAWVNALSLLIEQPTLRALIRQTAYRHVTEYFNVDNAVAQWLTIISQLTVNNNARPVDWLQLLGQDSAAFLTALPKKCQQELRRKLEKP